jgi:hypothetical protein
VGQRAARTDAGTPFRTAGTPSSDTGDNRAAARDGGQKNGFRYDDILPITQTLGQAPFYIFILSLYFCTYKSNTSFIIV